MNKYSQHGEEAIIKDYFPIGYIGGCIDIGASDGIGCSNTLLLEELGWYCLCIEPNPNLFEHLKKIRKNSVNYAISDKNVDTVFNIASIEDSYLHEDAISSLKIDERLLNQHKDAGYNININTVPVKTLTLDECIRKYYKYPTIDFLSIDTEGTELDVLKGFDINFWKPKLMVIENNFNDPEIEQYLKEFGYEKVHRLVINDFYLIQ